MLLARVAPPGKSVLVPLRDWLPCALIVLAYRESGLFIQPDVTRRLDVIFEAWDRVLLGSAWFQSLVAFGSPWLGRLMELVYLLVYPFIPLGFAAVYFSKRGARDAAPPVAPNASRLGIEVVQSVGECLDILSAPREKEGLLGQIKRIFTRTGQG